MAQLPFVVVRSGLFAATLVLLVTRRPARWRMIAGVVCIVVYAVLTLVP
jgi:hypothetical protein